MQVTERHLKHFSGSEFVRDNRNWLPSYNPRFLILLDVFRALTGPCILSPHPMALGRMTYPKNPGSKHIYKVELGVRAGDTFPTLDLNPEEWVQTAQSIGFTGIGLYPEWTYDGETRMGMHLDVREAPLYTWSYIGGEMKPISEAFNL